MIRSMNVGVLSILTEDETLLSTAVTGGQCLSLIGDAGKKYNKPISLGRAARLWGEGSRSYEEIVRVLKGLAEKGVNIGMISV